MTYYCPTIKFDQTLSILEESEEWLSNVGVPVVGTRFSEILETVRIIVDHYKRKKISKLLENYPEANLYYALTDATAFIRVYYNFKNLKSDKLPRAKLKEMLIGPLLPWDEAPDKGNIHGRNILFELETAARFMSAGLNITSFDDVQFNYRKHAFNVQCKRIHSPRRIRDSVSDAVQQITKRMNKNPDMKGLICLSIDKISEKEGLILEVRTEKDIEPHIARIPYEFIDSYRDIWQHLINIHILGTLIVFNAVAIIYDNAPLLTQCRQVTLDIIPQRTFYQLKDYRLINALGKEIKRSLQ
jgi:hypothetical protein